MSHHGSRQKMIFFVFLDDTVVMKYVWKKEKPPSTLDSFYGDQVRMRREEYFGMSIISISKIARLLFSLNIFTASSLTLQQTLGPTTFRRMSCQKTSLLQALNMRTIGGEFNRRELS